MPHVMTDKEILDLIDSFRWQILHFGECPGKKDRPGRMVILENGTTTKLEPNIREAIKAAMTAQVKWALDA